MKIQTLAAFKSQAQNMSSSEVYELYENATADSIRDSIQYLGKDSPEPVRAGLEKLGIII